MATQKGRNWSSGDIVTAANLSSIERGVSAVAEEYTPTTWANGNTVMAAALNNIEQGIANAGGGSSDFSMINVTVVGTLQGAMPFVFNEGELGEGAPAMLLASHQTWESGTYKLALYKGETVISILNVSSISGNITHFDEDIYVITGDCTITIS